MVVRVSAISDSHSKLHTQGHPIKKKRGCRIEEKESSGGARLEAGAWTLSL